VRHVEAERDAVLILSAAFTVAHRAQELIAMKLNSPAVLVLLGAASASAAPSTNGGHGAPPCRFALEWTQDDVLHKTDDFISDVLYWEGKFHQNDIAYNTANGMTYDGSQIDWETGEATEKHVFSAASKEVRARNYASSRKVCSSSMARLCKSCCTRAQLMDPLKLLGF
jgi:hypothetical protein